MARKMQKQITVGVTVGTKLTSTEYDTLRKVVDAGTFLNVSDFIREAVREKLEAIEIIKIRDIDYKTAKKEVLGYFQKYGEAYPSDAANDLGLEMETVNKITAELRKEGRLGEA